MDVWYDPSNPGDADLNSSSRTWGWILLTLFGGYLFFRWIKMGLMLKFRWFAAYEGAGDIKNLMEPTPSGVPPKGLSFRF